MTTGADLTGALAAVLIAFGIVAPPDSFGGGMLLALGCSYAVRAFRPVDSRKGLALSLFAAILAAMLVAGLHDHTHRIWVWGSLPLQIQMAFVGALSQALFELVAARGSGMLGKLADKAGIGENK
jgi:hypothetical protein